MCRMQGVYETYNLPENSELLRPYQISLNREWFVGLLDDLSRRYQIAHTAPMKK